MNASLTPATDAPLYLTIAGACAKSGLGRSTIYLALASGELKARKAGQRTLIDCASLSAWLDALPAWAAQNGVAA